MILLVMNRWLENPEAPLKTNCAKDKQKRFVPQEIGKQLSKYIDSEMHRQQ